MTVRVLHTFFSSFEASASICFLWILDCWKYSGNFLVGYISGCGEKLVITPPKLMQDLLLQYDVLTGNSCPSKLLVLREYWFLRFSGIFCMKTQTWWNQMISWGVQFFHQTRSHVQLVDWSSLKWLLGRTLWGDLVINFYCYHIFFWMLIDDWLVLRFSEQSSWNSVRTMRNWLLERVFHFLLIASTTCCLLLGCQHGEVILIQVARICHLLSSLSAWMVLSLRLYVNQWVSLLCIPQNASCWLYATEIHFCEKIAQLLWKMC